MKQQFLFGLACAAMASSCAGGSTDTPNQSLQDSTNVSTKDSVQTTTEELPTLETDSFSIKGTTYKLTKVEGGETFMGASHKEKGLADEDETPNHKITVESFYMAQLEVTQKLWNDVMGKNPSAHKGDLYPVENISWIDCQAFIEKLNKLTGQAFRLPTEAEWEYAARGGKYTHHYIYAGSDNVDEVAWYDENRGKGTHEVGTKKPNELGLYDMSGNVAEWCNDWYDATYYAKSEKDSPKGPKTGDYRVLRGGGWFVTNKSYTRCANRSGNTTGYTFDYLGMRLAKDAK